MTSRSCGVGQGFCDDNTKALSNKIKLRDFIYGRSLIAFLQHDCGVQKIAQIKYPVIVKKNHFGFDN